MMVDHSKSVAAGAAWLGNDETVTLTMPDGFFLHVCCDCGMVHRVHVHDHKSLTLRWERLDELPLEGVSANLVKRVAG